MFLPSRQRNKSEPFVRQLLDRTFWHDPSVRCKASDCDATRVTKQAAQRHQIGKLYQNTLSSATASARSPGKRGDCFRIARDLPPPCYRIVAFRSAKVGSSGSRCKTSQSGRPGESVILSEAKNLAYFAGNGDPSLRSG